MIENLTNAQRILKQLEKKGKVEYLNQPKYFKVMKKMNEAMDRIKKESKIKQRRSELSASKVVLTS